jgi:hypothetical protein
MPPTGVGAIRGLRPVVPRAQGGYETSNEPIFQAQQSGR